MPDWGSIGTITTGLRPYGTRDPQFDTLFIDSDLFALYPEGESLRPVGSVSAKSFRPVFPVAFLHLSEPRRGLASSGKHDIDGSQAPPSFVIRAPFSFLTLRVPVLAGSRTLSVKARQVLPATPRPMAVLRADGTVVATEQSASAPAGAGWVTISIPFTALADGAVDVDLWNTTCVGTTETFFDDLKVI